MPRLETLWLLPLLQGLHGTNAGPIVQTANGPLEGVETPTGMRYFRGIPYAAPPVGDLRLRPPQPMTNWSGVLNATEFGANCYQINVVDHGQVRCPAWATIQGCDKLSEDCLVMNIVTPKPTAVAPATQKWPVILYLHAGEFFAGASNDLESNWPYGLHDIVLVSVNFRIGPQGFSALDELRDRDPTQSTGNYGIQDQRMAMKWIQQNIDQFGGDPNNVALMGESSGGTSVAAHLTLKRSWGLFHKVIMESPGITQSLTWEASSMNTKYRIVTLAAYGVHGCKLLPFTGDYDTPGAWLELPGVTVYGKTQWSGAYSDTKTAVNTCAANATCCAVTCYNVTEPTTNTTEVKAIFSTECEATRQRGATPSIYTTFVRGPNMTTAVDCLMGLSISELYGDNKSPYSDTIFFDEFAPTVDGVEFKQPLTAAILSGPLAPGVDVLLGSNLDEGTEFISDGATCAMTPEALAAWAQETFASDPVDFAKAAVEKIVAGVAEVYIGNGSNLELPVPKCNGATYPANAAYLAATRATGDSGFFCWVQALANRLTTELNYTNVFHYFFTHSPAGSLNWPSSLQPLIGAFHGAEVPFVFGFPDEINTEAELAMSNAMGCYWSNFAHTGNPNQGPCNTTPAAWPQYRDNASTAVTNTLIIDSGNATGLPPSAPIHVVHNHRDDKCALYSPLVPGLTQDTSN